ncbi:MAG: hypothetical protein ACOH15_06395 [Acetobacterium sp.]
MNINNFENHINGTILDRGYDYYTDGNVIEIYKEHIKVAASFAKNRRDYQGVCGIIKRYKKMAGKQNQETIINELAAFYKKRPAFVDELSKI